MKEIVELRSEPEFREAFPIMQELRPQLNEEQFLELLTQMIPGGYRLFALRDLGRIVALAGVAVCTNLYDGRHVWVYDLITTRSARSQGYGQQLLESIEALARQEQCLRVVLSSGFHRTDAHRFYQERVGYNKKGYVFMKELS